MKGQLGNGAFNFMIVGSEVLTIRMTGPGAPLTFALWHELFLDLARNILTAKLAFLMKNRENQLFWQAPNFANFDLNYAQINMAQLAVIPCR